MAMWIYETKKIGVELGLTGDPRGLDIHSDNENPM